MFPQDLEPEMEEFLLRLVPGLASRWEGATEDEIHQIEHITGQELPRFYRWFLMRMGHRTGLDEYASMDFSASKILSSYAEELFAPEPRFLMIGYESDEVMPLHLLYDFDYPARDDARVFRCLALGGPSSVEFETFREMIAWGTLQTHAQDFPNYCRGLIRGTGESVPSQLYPVMSSLGFKSPIASGPYCALFEGSQAAMVTSGNPTESNTRHGFHLGGSNKKILRDILGVIVAETSLDIKIRENDPRRL